MCQIVPSGDGWAFVSGRGWGHGVGMCQYGAEGMARLGSDAESHPAILLPRGRDRERLLRKRNGTHEDR